MIEAIIGAVVGAVASAIVSAFRESVSKDDLKKVENDLEMHKTRVWERVNENTEKFSELELKLINELAKVILNNKQGELDINNTYIKKEELKAHVLLIMQENKHD